ncbi:MAG: hypothetical protein NTX46_02605 [Chloroflexi bacterium]|nr:hypothetical protein [Chloroflexota bacterium]
MLKRFCFLLSLVLGIALLSGCNSALKAFLGSEFILSVGQNARIASESMEIKLIAVTEDSRCPKNVQCIQAGKVSCDVEISKDGTKSHILLTQTGLTDNSGEYTYQNYIIVFDVSPYPEAGKQISSGDYRLSLIFSKSAK